MAFEAITDFVRRHPRLVVITGAGCSAPSGIPTYRNAKGEWLRSAPIEHQAFVRSAGTRQRYWARSFAGWPTIRDALPNPAHHALARLEARGHIRLLVTQNIDGLHQKAGQRNVTELHGRLERVLCLDCGAFSAREVLQQRLAAAVPGLAQVADLIAPDGDAVVEDSADFCVPDCERCGGTLKPDVVFFGGGVPKHTITATCEAIAGADGVLVVGSSLMVFSGFRFCKRAAEAGKPIAIINRGQTRADDLAEVREDSACEDALQHLASELCPSR